VPAELYINKARLLLKLKLYKDAEVSIYNYLKRVPEPGFGYFILANIHSATSRLEQALHNYNKVGNTPELKAKAHNNRALIYIKKKIFRSCFKRIKSGNHDFSKFNRRPLQSRKFTYTN